MRILTLVVAGAVALGSATAAYADSPLALPDWVGVHAGAETADGIVSIGSFGEVQLGTEWRLGHAQIGIYGAAGVSVEQTREVAPSPTTDPDLPTTAPVIGSATGGYVTVGWRIAFG